MQQLNATDGMFLSMDMQHAPQHIAGLNIYDPSTSPNKFVRFKEILKMHENRMHRSAIFRRKLAEVPMNFDQPFWVDDPNFDLEFHIRHIALPKPGDWRQLCILIARLHSLHLDHSRPLWETYVIEGLDNVEGLPPGCFATYTKVHHAAVDGMGATELQIAVHDFEPNPPADDQPPPQIVQSKPSKARLIGAAALNTAKRNRDLFGYVGDVIKRRKTKQEFESENGPEPKLGERPVTLFNQPVSGHMVFSGIDLPINDMKAIRKAAPGCSLNDVSTTIVSIALRNYLAGRGEVHEDTLRAMMPVSLRTAEQAKAGGNSINNIQVPIHTDITEPLEVLKAVTESTQYAKKFRSEVGEELTQKLSEYIPPNLQKALGKASSIGSRFGGKVINVNTTVTNVPGPNFPMYMCGAKLLKCYGVGLVVDGLGLFNIVTSYNGMLNITATACREQMPDPQVYRQCIKDAFEELHGAAMAVIK